MDAVTKLSYDCDDPEISLNSIGAPIVTGRKIKVEKINVKAELTVSSVKRK